MSLLFTRGLNTVKVIKSNCGVRLVRTVVETADVMLNRKRDDQSLEREGQQQPEKQPKKQRTRGGGLRQLPAAAETGQCSFAELLKQRRF